MIRPVTNAIHCPRFRERIIDTIIDAIMHNTKNRWERLVDCNRSIKAQQKVTDKNTPYTLAPSKNPSIRVEPNRTLP